MSSCNFFAPNGEPSILYAELEQKYGTDQAVRMWNWAHTQPMFEQLDVNGEPTLPVVEENMPQLPESFQKGPNNDTDLPSKEEPGPTELPLESFETTSMDNFKKSYERHIETARANPNVLYVLPFVPSDLLIIEKKRITGAKLAQLLDRDDLPYNITFKQPMMGMLQNLPKRFTNIQLDSPNPMQLDEDVVAKQMDLIFVQVRDAEGKATGQYFQHDKQNEAIDSIIYRFYNAYASLKPGESLKISKVRERIYAEFNGMRATLQGVVDGTKTLRGMDKDQAAELLMHFIAVTNAFFHKGQKNSLWNFAMNKLEAYGIKVRQGELSEKTDEQVPVNEEENPNIMEEIEGGGLRDFSDSSLELDMKDTASTRMKLFLLSTVDSSFENEIEPPRAKISFTNEATQQMIYDGLKRDSFRDAETFKKLGMMLPQEIPASLSAPEKAKLLERTFTMPDGSVWRVQADFVITEEWLSTPVQVGLEETNGQRLLREEGFEPKAGDVHITFKPYTQQVDIVVPKRNFLNMYQLADYETLFADLQGLLAEREPEYKVYREAMEQSGNANILQVLAKLEDKKTGEHIRKEFVSVMSAHQHKQLMILFTKGRGGSIEPQIVDSNRASELQLMLRKWQEAQKVSAILKRNEKGETIIDPQLSQELWDELMAIYNTKLTPMPDAAYFDDIAKKAGYKERKKRENAIKEIRGKEFQQLADRRSNLFDRLMSVNGITLDPRAKQTLFNKIAELGEGTKINTIFGGFTDKGDPIGLVDILISRLHRQSPAQDNDEHMGEDDAHEAYKANNPLYTEKTAIGLLTRVQHYYEPQLYSRTHRSVERKTIQGFGLNTSLSHAVRRFKTMPEYRAMYKGAYFNSRSWLLEQLENEPLSRDKFQMRYIDGLKKRYSSRDGVTRDKMSSREQWLTVLSLFQNRGSYYKGHFVSLTHSDKTKSPVFYNVPKVYDTAILTKGGIITHPKFVDLIYNHVFLAEYDRITNPGGENIAGYSESKKNFYLLPRFNYNEMAQLVGPGGLTQEEFNSVWSQDKRLRSVDGLLFKKVAQKVIRLQLNEMVNDTLSSWEESGLLDVGLPGSSNYFDSLFRRIGYDKDVAEGQQVWVPYDQTMSTLRDNEEIEATRNKLAAMDYTLNAFLVNTSLSQLFFGDPALIPKNGVPKVLVEYGKRLAKDIAPGRDGEFSHSPTYRTVTALDFEPIVQELSNIPAYKDAVNASDAQEITTVQEHLDVLFGYGKISDTDYYAASNIIANAKGGYYTFKDIPGLEKLILQPMKPLGAGLRAPIDGVMNFDYVKTSSFALYPPVTKGMEIDSLRLLMEIRGTARMNFVSGKKMGAPAKAMKLFTDEGKFNQDLFTDDSWTDAAQEMHRSEFRLQQEVPYDADKDEILTISQMNKNLVEKIANMTTPFTFQGKEYSGLELRKVKEQLREKMFARSHQEFLQKVGAERVMTPDGPRLVFKDKRKFYDLLAEEASNRPGYTLNDVMALTSKFESDGQLAIPLTFLPSASKIEIMIMSLIHKVVKIKVPGKSYIQASPAGFQFMGKWENMNLEESEIVWTQPFNGQLQTAHLGSDGQVKPAQVLVGFNYFNDRGERINIKDYMYESEGKKILDTSKLPKELFQFIAARIPNQGHSSMLPIEIVGFLPESMGDMIVVPAAITKQMGADFDVDKLYTYHRAYKQLEDGRFIPIGSKFTDPSLSTDPKYLESIFPDSKIKQVLYHGTQSDFESFRATRGTRGGIAGMDSETAQGIYFTSSKSTARDYAKEDGRILSVVLDMKNPAVVINNSAYNALFKNEDEIPVGEVRHLGKNVYAMHYQTFARIEPEVKAQLGNSDSLWVIGDSEDAPVDAAVGNELVKLVEEGNKEALVDFMAENYAKLPAEEAIVFAPEQVRVVDSGKNLPATLDYDPDFTSAIDGTEQNGYDINQYFDIHWSVLTHPEVYKYMMEPLDKSDLKDEAQLLNKAGKTPYYWSPAYQLKDFESMKGAKTMVGQTSLALTHNALMQTANVRLVRYELEETEDGKVYKVVKPHPIVVSDELGLPLWLQSLSGFGQSKYKGEIRTKADNIQIHQSESVDHAKNRTVDQVNMDPVTIVASLGMSRLQSKDRGTPGTPDFEPGEALNLQYNTRLLMQPIIRDYAAEMARINDSLSTNFSRDSRKVVKVELRRRYTALALQQMGYKSEDGPQKADQLLNELTQQLREKEFLGETWSGDEGIEKFTYVAANPERLLQTMNMDKNAEFYWRQVWLLDLYEDFENVGHQLVTAQSIMSQDTRGAGENMLDALRTDEKRQKLGFGEDERLIEGLEEMYHTELAASYDATIGTAIELMEEDLPYNAFTPLYEWFAEESGRVEMTNDQKKEIFDGIRSYVMSSANLGLTRHAEKERIRLLYGSKDQLSLAKRIQQAKNTWGRNNYFLQRLQPVLDPDGLTPDLLEYNAAKKGRSDEFENTRAWLDMLTSKNPQIQELAQDLLRYTYVTGGLQSASNFVKFVPWSVIQGSQIAFGIRESLQLVRDAPSTSLQTQIFQHNPELAKQLSTGLTELGSPEELADTLILPPINMEKEQPTDSLSVRKLDRKTGKFFKWYPDHISWRNPVTNKWMLFKADGIDPQTKAHRYLRIDTLGGKNIKEYNANALELVRSVFPDNRSTIYDQKINPLISYAQGRFQWAANPKKVAQQMGINKSELDFQETMEAMEVISVDGQQPAHIRTLAGLMRTMNRNPVEVASVRLLGIGLMPLKLKLVPDMMAEGYPAGTMGAFRVNDTVLQLNEATLYNKVIGAETFLHEMIHYQMSLVLWAMNTDDELRKKKLNEPTIARIKVIRAFVQSNPEILRKAQAVVEMQREAFNRLKEMIMARPDGQKVWAQTMRLEGEFGKLYYGLSDPIEFMAHVLTNPEVMDFLNLIPWTGKKTMLDHIKDLFAQLWASMMEAFGARPGTYLEESARRVLDLMMLNQKVNVKKVQDLSGDQTYQLQGLESFSRMAANKAMPGRDKVIGKLEEQIADLRASYTGVTSPFQRHDKNMKIQQIEADIKQLREETDLDIGILTEIGKRQLKWITDVAKKADPNANEIMTAVRIGEMWRSIIDLIYGENPGETDPELGGIVVEANKAASQLTKLGRQLLTNSSGGTIRGDVDFEPENLRDVSQTSGAVRSLSSAASSRVLQHVANFVETTARQRNEDVYRLQKELTKLERDMTVYAGGKKNLQSVYDKLMQSGDDWGLVQQYSPLWFSWRRKSIGRRNVKLRQIDDMKENDITKSQLKKIVWAAFWEDVEKHAAWVDTRLFFEEQTGQFKADIAQAKADLAAKVGAEHVDTLLARAQERYLRYIEDRGTFFEMMDADVLAGLKTQEEADKEKVAYQNRHSPNVFFSSHAKKTWSSASDKYTTMGPLASRKDLWSQNYEEIKADPKLNEFYIRYQTILERLKSFLPKTLQEERGRSWLPIVNQALMQEDLNIRQYFETFAENQVRSVAASKQEEQWRQQIRNRIPLQFVYEEEADLADRSRDLIGILRKFGNMAMHYKHFSTARDSVELAETVIREIDSARRRGAVQQLDAKGRLVTVDNTLENTLKAFEYLKDYLMYNKPRALQFDTKFKIYAKRTEGGREFSLNPVEQARISKRVKELDAAKTQLEERYINQEMDLDEYVEQLAKIDEELNRYVAFNVYGSKIGDKLIGINQLKALSFNPFSAVSNLAFGMISMYVHANGGRDFTYKELAAAKNIIFGSILKKAAGNKGLARKLVNVVDRLGVIGDYTDAEYGKPVQVRENKPRWKRALDPYAMLKSSDFVMKGWSTVAVLLNRKVKVTEDGVEKEITVWESLNEEGYWDEARFGKRPEWYSDEVNEQTEWTKLTNRVIRVNMVLHGNQDKNSPKLINKGVFGRLIGQFRMSWLPEGWYTRTQQERYDEYLERNVKGRYRTIGDIGFWAALRVLGRQYLNVIPGFKVDIGDGVRLPGGKEFNQSEVDIENMKRNFAELNIYLGITAAILLLKYGLQDEDDETNPFLQMLVNIMIRSQQDIGFYISPQVFDTVTRNFIPASSVITDYLKAVKATGKVILDDDYEVENWMLALTRAGIPIPQAALVNKVKYMSTHDLDDLQ